MAAAASAGAAAARTLDVFFTPYRTVFWLAVIPGLGSALAFALLVREPPRSVPVGRKFLASVRDLPGSFRKFLVAVGVFGAGDYSHTLLILAATVLLTPAHGPIEAAKMAALLYAWHNGVQAAVSYPIGALGDRYGRQGVLLGGYGLGALVSLGFAAAFWAESSGLVWLAVLFAAAGTCLAVQEALEGALTADLVLDTAIRGTAYGVMGTVNGIGKLVASVLVGMVWRYVGPAEAFASAAVLMLLGAVLLSRR